MNFEMPLSVTGNKKLSCIIVIIESNRNNFLFRIPDTENSKFQKKMGRRHPPLNPTPNFE